MSENGGAVGADSLRPEDGYSIYCKVLDIGDNDRSAGGWTEVP